MEIEPQLEQECAVNEEAEQVKIEPQLEQECAVNEEAEQVKIELGLIINILRKLFENIEEVVKLLKEHDIT